MLATYAMARGWVDFWLCWIAVDLVGVPLLLHSRFYPSAVLYAVYAGVRGLGLRRSGCGVAPTRGPSRSAAPPRDGTRCGLSRQVAAVRLDDVERAIADIAAGRPVVVVDDEDRENEGDLIFAAAQGDPRAARVHDPAHVGGRLRADGGRRAATGCGCRR